MSGIPYHSHISLSDLSQHFRQNSGGVISKLKMARFGGLVVHNIEIHLTTSGAHIALKAFFEKISFVGPKNRFFTDRSNVTKCFKNDIQVFFEVGLTPNYRGFIVDNV